MSYAYYNGFFGDFDEIRIPLSDRSVFFADGVYDAAIGKNGKIYLEELHVRRFTENAKKIGLHLGFGEEKLCGILRETVKKSGIDEFFLYFQVTGYLPERLHAPRNSEKSNLLVTVKPFALREKNTELSLVSYPDIRQSFCNVKTLNLLGSVLASEYAESFKCDEALFVKGQHITECAHSNVFIIFNEKLITHPCDEKILPGIMRREVLLAANKLGAKIIERPFSLSELFSASDVIVTSTSKLALRAKSVDGIALSNKKTELCSSIIDEMFKCYEDFC